MNGKDQRLVWQLVGCRMEANTRTRRRRVTSMCKALALHRVVVVMVVVVGRGCLKVK